MPQNTNAVAYQQLRPLENTNYGELVLNHIKYMKDTKSKEEALQYERDMQKQEFDRRDRIEGQKFVTGLSDIEGGGYWQGEMMKYKNINAEKIPELTRRIQAGGLDGDKALLEYNRIINNAKSLANAGDVVSKKIAELSAEIESGNYNKYTDAEKVELVESLKNSNYILDPNTAKLRVYSKDGTKVLLDIDPNSLTNGILQTTFDEMPNFNTIGSEIAKSINVPTIDDQTIPSEKNILSSENQWKTRLKQDNTLLETAIGLYNVDISNGIDDIVLANIASKLSTDYTEERWKITKKSDETLEAEKEKAKVDLNYKRALTNKANRIPKENSDNETPKETISVITNEQGSVIKTPHAGDSFSIALPKLVRHGNTVYTGANILEGGGVELIGWSNADIVDGEMIKTKNTTRHLESNKQDVGEVVKRVNDGKTKTSTFDDTQEFYKKAIHLKNEKAGKVGGLTEEQMEEYLK